MDDKGLPLSSPLPLFRPAVQALNDIPDAPPSSESTGGAADVHPVSTRAIEPRVLVTPLLASTLLGRCHNGQQTHVQCPPSKPSQAIHSAVTREFPG